MSECHLDNVVPSVTSSSLLLRLQEEILVMRLITELCVNILKHFQTSKLGVSTDLCVVNKSYLNKIKKENTSHRR